MTSRLRSTAPKQKPEAETEDSTGRMNTLKSKMK